MQGDEISQMVQEAKTMRRRMSVRSLFALGGRKMESVALRERRKEVDVELDNVKVGLSCRGD